MKKENYNPLYETLYNMAWNTATQSERNIEAIKTACELFNGYDIKSDDHLVHEILLYQKFNITINKATKIYTCENNYEHKIKKSDHYGNVWEKIPTNTNRFCLSCSAKFLIIFITSFPPTVLGGYYSVLADEFNFK